MPNMMQRAGMLLVATMFCLAMLGRKVQASDRLTEHQLQIAQSAQSIEGQKLPERVSGYFRLDREHTDKAEMFYFYFENRNRSSSAPLVLWLTGGPGCSGSLAVFAENGPYAITKSGGVEERKYAWDVEANMIFVDQPLNVGFSYSEDPIDRVYTEEQVSADLLDFMQVFLKARPHLADLDFFITGESYAGHYIPATAAHFVRSNAARAPGGSINLKGVAIGNGLTDVAHQFGTYAAFAEAKGLISQAAAESIQALWFPCQLGIAACNSGIPMTCQLAQMYCFASQFQSVVALTDNVNIYDVRKKCEGALCYDFSDISTFLNDPNTQKKLGVRSQRPWQECDYTVNADMSADEFLNYAPEVTFLLESGLPVLIYAGSEDLICNDLGQDLWTKALPWSGRNAFNAAGNLEWRVGGDIAGLLKTSGNFTHASVLNAGHMVPMDQPVNMLHLLRAFLKGKDMSSLFDTTSGDSGSKDSSNGKSSSAVLTNHVQVTT